MHKIRNTGYQKNIYSATLFAMAILVLVVSCPLKSFLKNNDVAQSSIPYKSKQTNNYQYSGILYSSAATGCTFNNKTPVLQAFKSQLKKLNALVFTINIFNHTSFYNHSFVDAIKAEHNLGPGSDNSSLPLFLQHRSLLI